MEPSANVRESDDRLAGRPAWLGLRDERKGYEPDAHRDGWYAFMPSVRRGAGYDGRSFAVVMSCSQSFV